MRINRQPIRGVGRVLAPLQSGLHSVVLDNGYEVLAHLDRKLDKQTKFTPGQRLLLEFSPYDMTQARILAVAD